jgi:hypothetical protein
VKTRAIYIPDIRYDECKVFELKGDRFICITNSRLSYNIDVVLSDNSWIVASIIDDKVENVR